MDTLPQFVAAVLVLLIIPGPDMAYCIATGMSNGAKGALFAAVGVGVGGLVLTACTTFVVFLSSGYNPDAFAFLQIFGSLYLLYLGVTILVSKNDGGKEARKKTATHSIFLRGVITNISNPKALVFFISFIPQFIPTHAQAPHLLALILGAILCAIGTTINFLFGLSGVSLQILTTKKIMGRSVPDCVTAFVFISIAIIFLGNYLSE